MKGSSELNEVNEVHEVKDESGGVAAFFDLDGAADTAWNHRNLERQQNVFARCTNY